MFKKRRLFKQEAETLDEKYFSEIRPKLYELHASHAQCRSREGRSLAEHLDSACQFVLTISKIAKVPDDRRAVILAATAVHDLNKIDTQERSVKTLARDRTFLKEQLQLAGVESCVKTDEDLELVRRLIERHSGHGTTDGLRFLPEDPEINAWAAMLIGGDLYDLGIEKERRMRKVENELTVALRKDTKIFEVRLSQDRGYLTALLLSACEEVLGEKGLVTLAIEPDAQLFVGDQWPDDDVSAEIAQRWHRKINKVFGSNISQLVKASKDGIKVDPQAVQQNPEGAIDQVDALLAKKFSSYKADKVSETIQKYGKKAGEAAVAAALEVDLSPVSTGEEFAISEGLKAAYLSYREAQLSPKDAWDRIAEQVQISPEQRAALEPFDALYGRGLFAAGGVVGGLDAIASTLQDSFQLRTTAEASAPQFLIEAVSHLLSIEQTSHLPTHSELSAYIDANPRARCSLGATSTQVEELISAKMPPETKVQAFSNRLPGGMSAEPKRRADSLSALSYQLMAIGANLPKATKQPPWYLHFALPKGSGIELKNIWRRFLQETAATNEDGPVTVDELALYKENSVVFRANKVVGMALPKRAEFTHATVTIPVLWGDVNNSVALLKSLRLALEMALALDIGFPFVLSASLEVDPSWNIFGSVEGIPSALSPLLGSGRYQREGHLLEDERAEHLTAEVVLERLQCIGQLTIAVASLRKKDDCLYDLARAAKRPLTLYHVLLRWLLREQDDPNLERTWTRIKQPLNTLLETLMSEEHDKVSHYLKQAAHIAETGKLRGSSFRRTAQIEPFAEFIKAVRAKKAHMDWETVFAALVQQYHNRLDRIREHGVGATKYEQVSQFYNVLRAMFKDVYSDRPDRLLADGKTLEAAYLFFLQEARKEIKDKTEKDEK